MTPNNTPQQPVIAPKQPSKSVNQRLQWLEGYNTALDRVHAVLHGKNLTKTLHDLHTPIEPVERVAGISLASGHTTFETCENCGEVVTVVYGHGVCATCGHTVYQLTVTARIMHEVDYWSEGLITLTELKRLINV